MKQDTGTGIGRALRAARQKQGKSLETVGRETRVRTDYLEALEREDFEAPGSDVGLSHEKVIAAYERAYGGEALAPAPVERAPGVGPTEAHATAE
jgi:transcriptional regulator with XRE-family HTH domain